MRKLMLVTVGLTVGVVGGCGALGDLFSLGGTRVRLVNATDYTVEVTMYLGDEQLLPEFLLTSTGDEVNVTIPAGSSRTVSRDCDALQAIVIDNAELSIIGDIGPTQDTDVYRDGDDFNCGDTLVFTFTAPSLPTELNISFSAE